MPQDPVSETDRRRRLAKHNNVTIPDVPHTGGQSLRSYHPSPMERIGNAAYDALKDIGLPVDRMGRDLRNVDNFVRGTADTLTVGLADEIAAGANAALGGDYDAELERQRLIDKQGWPYRTAGQLAGGLIGGVGLAKKGLSPAANAIRRGDSKLKLMGKSALEGGILSAFHGYGSGEGLSDRVRNTVFAAPTGAVMGAVVPELAPTVSKIISPFDITPQRQVLIDALRRERINTTAGQKTASKGLQSLENRLGGRRAADFHRAQERQYTAAALKRAGINADRATRSVLESGLEDIGKRFERLADRNRFVVDSELARDLATTLRQYRASVPPKHRATIVHGTLDELVKKHRAGNLNTDRWYQQTRPRMERVARQAQDKHLAEALQGIRDSMDNALERSIISSNRGDVGPWKATRRLRKNYDVIEDAMKQAGSDRSTGIVRPTQLRKAAVRQNPSAYSTGQSDFSQLSRAGEEILSSAPTSGAARGNAKVPPPGLLGSALMSQPVQRYLANQAGQSLITPQRRALINAMINSTGSSAVGRLRSSPDPR